MLIGSSGIGKTFLFINLVQEHGALFLCDHDPESIADAVREQQPTIVLVEDAYSPLDRLESLANVRKQVGGDFRIIASSWPVRQFAQSIESVLASNDLSTIELKPLDDRRVLDVIELAGIKGPIVLQAMIRQQSAGMPGLAVTLCNLFVNSKITIESIASGEALLSQLMPQLFSNIDQDTLSTYWVQLPSVGIPECQETKWPPS